MKIETRFTFDSVDHSKENEVHAVISLKAPKLDWQKKRQPICIVPVIDISSSMSGQKLDYAKKSVLKLIDQLQPGDYCGLVAFGSNVFPVADPREMTQSQKDDLKAKVGGLGVNGCTNFSGGMRQALEWVNAADLSDKVSLRVIMFTDGMANQGEATGRDLVPLCKNLLGKATLSCFGYGSDADQELLADIATEGKGNYAFIKNPDDALTAFAKELGGLLSRYAQDIVVDVAPFNGHKIEEVLSDVDVEEDGGKVKIVLPEILSEEERHLVLKVITSKQTSVLPRAMNVLDVKVEYDQVGDGEKAHRSEEVKAKLKFVKSGEEQKEPTKEVMEVVGIAMTVQAQIQAEEQAKAGNWAGAQAALVANAQLMDNFNLHQHASFSKGLSANYVNSGVYTCSAGYRESVGRGLTRSVGTSDKEAAIALNSVGLSAGNAAMDWAESQFTDDGDPDVVKQSVTAPAQNVSISIGGAPVSGSGVFVSPTPPPQEKPKKKKKTAKKGVSKNRSSRW